MPHRAFCEDVSGVTAALVDSEAHHVINVLRGKIGEELELFDGTGAVVLAVIASVTRRDVSCEVISRLRFDAVPRQTVTVSVAPPKGERLKWMVEKLTEIGVDQLRLMQTQRTVVVPGETRIDKLRATVISACKQSRRNVLMTLTPLTSFDDVVAPAVDMERPIRLLAHPDDSSRSLSAALATTERERGIDLMIGPEGGFTPDEVQRAVRSGCITVAWPGTQILRIETAAVALASIVLHSRS